MLEYSSYIIHVAVKIENSKWVNNNAPKITAASTNKPALIAAA